MTRTFKLAAATATAALLSFSVPALASPFMVSQQNPSNAHGSYAHTNITIKGPTVKNSPSKVSVGAFALTADASAGTLAGDFIAWCLDVGNSLDLPAPYSVTDNPFFSNTISATVLGTLTKLANTAYKTVQANLDVTRYSAGFQLALWEILSETSGTYDINSGTFSAESDNGQAYNARTQANVFLAGLNGPATGNYKLTYLQSEPEQSGGIGTQSLPAQASQDLVTISEVPLPAAGFLLIGALGGLGVFARRRKAAV